MSTTIDTMVEETANGLLGDLCDQALVEAAEAGQWPAKLWTAVTEAGLTTALDEGLDGLPAALAVARATGATPTPVPLVETILARGLAHAAGLALPEGPATIAQPRFSEVRLAREGTGARLTGSLAGVPFARWCTTVAVAADKQLALVPVGAVTWGPRAAYSGEPLDNGEATASLPAGAVGALAADAVRMALAITVQYANDRVQFGRAIGKFQSIQHLVAVMAENAAAADTASNMALKAWGTPQARLMLAAAKIRCGEAAGIVAETAHQVHGAIGFTREHRLHHLTRRLWSWRDQFGHEGDWAGELGRLALARGPGSVWPLLTEA